MAKKHSPENTIAELTHGDVEAVIFLKESPFDRYRYPAFILRRRWYSKSGKEMTPQGDFFEYNSDDIINAVKDARAFIKRYQQNPKAAVEEGSKRNDSQALAA